MKAKTDFAAGARRSSRATSRASQVLLQAEGAGIGTEYGDRLLEQAITLARRERIPVADPLKEAKAILTDALCHRPQHAETCEARRFAEHNGYLPASHPAWNCQPPCTCWVGRLTAWLSNYSEV